MKRTVEHDQSNLFPNKVQCLGEQAESKVTAPVSALLLNMLPEDALLEVCKCIPNAEDLIRFAATCHLLWRIGSSDDVWKDRWCRQRGMAFANAMTHLLQQHPNLLLQPVVK
ncbi:hypothetical protein QOT17_020244 [Balamuthia mandrillaris]